MINVMSNVWNNCPICGKELIGSRKMTGFEIKCPDFYGSINKHHYYAGLFGSSMFERFVIGEFTIERFGDNLIIYYLNFNNKIERLYLPKDILFNRINTRAKILALLVLS